MRSPITIVLAALAIAAAASAAEDMLVQEPRTFAEMRSLYERARPPAPSEVAGLWSGYCVAAPASALEPAPFRRMELLAVDSTERRFMRVPLVDRDGEDGWRACGFDSGFSLDDERRREVVAEIRGSRTYHRRWLADEGALRGELEYPGEPAQQDRLRRTRSGLIVRHDLTRPWDRQRRQETYQYCYFGARLESAQTIGAL